LEGYFENLVLQGFQNNLFFHSGTKKWGLAPPSGALTFQVVCLKDIQPIENFERSGEIHTLRIPALFTLTFCILDPLVRSS